MKLSSLHRPPYPWRSLLGICGQAAVEAVLTLIPAVVAWPVIVLLGFAFLTPTLARFGILSWEWVTQWLWASVLLGFVFWLRLLLPAWQSIFQHEYRWNHQRRVLELRQEWMRGSESTKEQLLRPADRSDESLLRPAGHSLENARELLRSAETVGDQR